MLELVSFKFNHASRIRTSPRALLNDFVSIKIAKGAKNRLPTDLLKSSAGFLLFHPVKASSHVCPSPAARHWSFPRVLLFLRARTPSRAPILIQLQHCRASRCRGRRRWSWPPDDATCSSRPGVNLQRADSRTGADSSTQVQGRRRRSRLLGAAARLKGRRRSRHAILN